MALKTVVTERKREEQLRVLGQSVANLIADAQNSSAAIQAVIRTICEAEQWECGRYLQPHSRSGRLYVSEAWGIDEPQITDFLERWRGTEYEAGGLAAEVWQSGQPIWTSDVSNETRALRRAKYLELGLRGAFMFPVKSGGEPIGVLAFNTRQSRTPDEPLLQAILAIGSLI